MGERNQSSGGFLIIHVGHVTMLAMEREAGEIVFSEPSQRGKGRLHDFQFSFGC
jgi:glycerol-3-phosphate cytidylyltransferase-like family protein